jgi:voltage-gated potassium channel
MADNQDLHPPVAGSATRPRTAVWRLVVRLTLLISLLAGVIVVGGGAALWLAERGSAAPTVRSWSDATWLALSTMTTVGYGDQVPTTAAGRTIAAAVMLAGVGIVGAVAAVVALAVAGRVAVEEERVLEAEAETLERRLEVRLDRMEAQLTAIDERLRQASAAAPGKDVG